MKKVVLEITLLQLDLIIVISCIVSNHLELLLTIHNILMLLSINADHTMVHYNLVFQLHWNSNFKK